MHLKQLKLAGFKSFVDPTIVPFPSQLVAVVGPNGCGKSNIIDAVRWVMGESSAKNLRGESMTDVIFNGSSQRKAVGQASIELVFDNSLGRLTGQFASYQEIAVKRVVTRDGDSSYYLNGSRCRRRDITDIFLGTGAGARGYSIIGQGTISRIIEARPEELRAFLEEAAGVSKYKERRKETLSRIEHTRENLARVADIREELDKQLQRLERQAKAAERYKQLKTEERLYKAEILALKWQSLTQEQSIKQQEIKSLLLHFEQHQSKAAEAYKESTELRERVHQDNEALQLLQESFYQLATEIARLEEAAQQHEREKQRLLLDQQQMQADWQQVSSQLEEDKELLIHSERLLVELEQNLQTQRQEFNQQQQLTEEKQREQKHWNQKAEQLEKTLRKAFRDLESEQFRIENLSLRRQQLLARIDKINDEQSLLSQDDVSHVLNEQRNSLSQLKLEVEIEEEYYQQVLAQESSLRQQLSETEQLIHQAQDKTHRFHTQQAALEAAQKAALGQDSNLLAKTTAWADKPCLVEVIAVEKQWQFACEFVLAEGLQAIVLDDFDTLWSELKNVGSYSALFISVQPKSENMGLYPRLSDKLTGLKPAWIHSLDKVYAIETLEEAIQALENLREDESVITPKGYWLAKKWIKVAGIAIQEEMGLLGRQDELLQLGESLKEAQDSLQALKTKRDDLLHEIKEQSLQLEQSKQKLTASRDALRACEADISVKTRALEQAEFRKTNLTREAEELCFTLEELAAEQENATQLLELVKKTSGELEQEQQRLAFEKLSWEDELLAGRHQIDELRAGIHQVQLQVDREKLKIQQLKENISREQLRIETLNERLETLAYRLVELEMPDSNLHLTLKEKVMQHQELESNLNQGRQDLGLLNTSLDHFETLVRTEEKQAKLIQEKMQQEQMQEQALAVRAAGLIEALTELDASLNSLLAGIPSGITALIREQEVQELGEKIKRLGAINLAAIEEYDSEFQRKHHLDEQYHDLMDALATLDSAIEKMDKETEHRLKTTFDAVNTAFQALFPRLFGGGRAMLELSCDNLLEAGVLVMAQPPGKRNSTIHLLSGGEKAMTAVALVFAIFQLNPSPFCMLDEVDAPLDDVNVGRFCDLVKEMSQFVQFLFITHNKVTMELADHLIGVTMREPGVSRVVAVDVEEALAMTGV